MCSDKYAIRIEAVSKCYQIYDNPRDRLKQFILPRAQSFFGQTPRQYFQEFWALQDISFNIKKGETLGIVGRNGSGKSTLLQIICGTLSPTRGTIETNGRIAALLELGSGFNPEFSGRENVYMNAAILGLKREEVDERYDDIVAFSDIGQFIEQPVKTYSSGMVVRLAFAVAINADPEILVIDEALAVGDELFQRKCFSRIEAIKKSGATILFVSHSGGTIVELCDRAVLIDSGEKLVLGKPKEIVGFYQKLLYAPDDKSDEIREQIRGRTKNVKKVTNTVKTDTEQEQLLIEEDQDNGEAYDPNLKPSSTIEYESHGAFIEKPMILSDTGKQVNNLIRGNDYYYSYTVRFDKSASNVHFGMLIKTISGVELGGGVTASLPEGSLAFVQAKTVCRIKFRFHCSLSSGVYFMNAGVIGVVDNDKTYLHRLIDIAMFRVRPDVNYLGTGIVDFGCYPEVQLVQE